MQLHSSAITDFVRQTAASLGQSFAAYWPADDDNDPVERNLSLHFAHALLNAGFSVFAEADHPNRKKVQGIDVVALAPEHDWFLACEFKRLYSVEKLRSLSDDIDRLTSFWLRTDYSEKMYGTQQAEAVSRCNLGYGLVGGLHWVSDKKESSKTLAIWRHSTDLSNGDDYSQVAAKLESLNAVLPDPPIVFTLPTGNRYYLLAAFFEIRRSGEAR